MIFLIDPAAQIFATGIIIGIFLTLMVVSIPFVFEIKGKEPEFVDIHNEHEDGHWICPRCGQDVSFYEWKNNYCSDCGQKIDWRKINGKVSV